MADETPERVLQAAREVFARDGYEGATTRQIAAAADVNIATLAYHFGGKEGLYRAVLDRMYARMLSVALPAPLAPDPRARIRQVVGVLWDFALAHELDIRLLLRQMLDRDAFRAEVGTRWTPEATTAGLRLLDAVALPPRDRPPRETLLALLTLNHLLARYAVTPAADRAAMLGPDADAAIADHLADLAWRLLG
jgi:AcrR family transcriptional regulator